MELNSVTQPQFSLVIERGRSRYPLRPLNEERFLIGAGSNCHLQLGGSMPILHSIIVRQSDHLWIDALVQDPPLLVNGQQVREGELKRGDVIEIGTFVFSVARADLPVASSSPAPVAAAPATPLAADETSKEPSPAELIHALVSELDELQELERRKLQGANALLEAARQSSSPSTAETVPTVTPLTSALSISQLELMEQLGIDSPASTLETESGLKKTA